MTSVFYEKFIKGKQKPIVESSWTDINCAKCGYRFKTTDKCCSVCKIMEAVELAQDDNVNSPSHYTSGGIETIDYMEAKSTHEEFCGHLRLTTIKYLSRAGLKDDEIQDLEKAAWYLNKLIKVRKDHGNTK